MHRIVQAEGRRFSLRLEPAFWTGLDRIARERGLRVGRLVRDIAQAMPPGANLASHVRLFCLAESERRVAALQVSVANLEGRGGTTDVMAVIDALPIPALLVGHDNTVRHVNAGFGRWFGIGHEHLLGKPVDRFLKLRTQLAGDQVRQGFAARTLTLALGHLMYVSPGRVAAAPCRMVPVQQHEGGGYATLILVMENKRA